MAVLLMVAVTIVLVGIVAVWVFQYNDLTEGGGDHYVFDIELDGTQDHIELCVVDGEGLNTSYARIMLNDNLVNLTDMMIFAGQEVDLVSPIDMEIGIYYNIKIIVNEKMIYDNDIIAAP